MTDLRCVHCGITASYGDANNPNYVGHRCEEAPERVADHEWVETDD